ncbi:dTDP-4-dehydrorhamnose 3,5-epimerase family protein [Actinomadura parmotrematis]|uniref:dTDP-4-dehydrorhamnose 3,5-epimerase n=1 Tax=Actinomadura parmotrematis TaxID=2864039 RepID=A0ABS7FN10_9ACTN|nr:dTDP-4-dehydrorhamnose 3,5-epimerase [Actinomadura parmotrematis]MBW8481615.1 dTDP-4-dehydrorhamnose 3,5-epimerase [Actinomadura parmotrematis]
MEPLGINGAFLFTPRVHGDARGSFHEWFRADALRAATGHGLGLAQANASVSARGVLRGVHYADVPPGQAKYITCVRGALLDVVVDLRTGSPTFGRWEAVRLDEENRRCLSIAEGLGHAFLSLEDGTTAMYLCSTGYNPAGEHGVHPLDPDLGIAWPLDVPPVLSDRDAAAPTLAEAQKAGALPDYERCLDFYAELDRGGRP